MFTEQEQLYMANDAVVIYKLYKRVRIKLFIKKLFKKWRANNDR